MRTWLPLFDQLKNYDLRHDMKSDLNAALIVAIMLIPQGMAYAMLAGLPPVVGLYASTVPVVIYALLGSSRQLAVGPVAMVSLLVYTGVSGIAEPGSGQYISYVLLLALMVGAIQLLLGLLKLGAVTKYISHAVISGFTSAAAIIIAFSQLDSLLGTDLGDSKNVFVILSQAVQQIGTIQTETILIGLASIVVLFMMKKFTPKIPGPLTAVVVSIAAVQLFNLDQAGVEVVGDIPGGMPSLTVPELSMDAVMTLLPIAVTIALIGFVESYAMAKVIATRERYAVNPDQELRALGAANIGTGFFAGFPVTGGFSRSAVNYDAGAKTGLAGMMTAVFVMLTLLFFTSWFYYLPQAVLAAIIIVAVYGLIDWREPKHLWQVKRADALTLIVTFAATLVIGIEAGIMTGVGFSLAVFLYRSGKPHMAELGYLEEEGVYRNVKRFPEAKTDDDKLIIRIDAPIYFANMAYIEEQLRDYMLEHPALEHVIFDFSSVNDIDAVAIDELEKWLHHHSSRGIRFYFVTVHGPVRDIFKRAGWEEKFADSMYYGDLNDAYNAAEQAE